MISALSILPFTLLCFSGISKNAEKESTKAAFNSSIPQGEGCNKDRKKAKQLVIDDFDNIAAEIESKAKSEMTFVIFASGGGTGSGAGPMLIDLLIDEGKTIGAITIIPAPDESVKSHINSYECFSELTEISGCGLCCSLRPVECDT